MQLSLHVCKLALSSLCAACAAGIARAGAGSAQPLLQHLYRTRAAAYRDAIREFVEGYRCTRPRTVVAKATKTCCVHAVRDENKRHP